MRAEFFRGLARRSRPHDGSNGSCSPRGVWYPNHGGIVNERVVQEDPLNFRRVDVLTTRDDEIAAAVNDVEKSGVIEISGVTGGEPGLPVLGKLTQVAGEDRGTSHLDFACDARVSLEPIHYYSQLGERQSLAG